MTSHSNRLSTRRPPTTTRPTPPSTVPLAAAGVGSLLLGGVGLWFLRRPDLNPLADPQQALLRLVLDVGPSTVVLLALAAVGMMTAAAGLGTRRSARWPGVVLAVSLLQVLGLGVALQSVSTISLAGYLVAMALPLGLVWLAVQVVRRCPRLRWVVLLAATVVITVGWVSEALRPETLARLAGDLGAGFARQALPLALVVAVALSAAFWAWTGLSLLQATGRVDAIGGWVQRHRRGLTLLAAAGPLPYGLVRASWLTPWPLLVPSTEALPAETRLWGLLLGGGAVLGCVLTVGLIRPWGRVFPTWMPGWAGRPVPPAAAIVPGALVAGLITASALPMLRLTLTPEPGTMYSAIPVLDRVLSTLVFPFWLWGPALALAVWGYARSGR